MNILEYENYQEKISHGNPLFPYITYLCSIPLDFSYVPIHWHDEMELIYIKKGHGIITVDFTQYQVSAGTLALIIPGQLHSIEQYENESMEYENIISELNEITTSLDATTETLVGLQENAKHEEAIKKIDVDLYLEAPIQELSRLANRLAELSHIINEK